MNKTGILDMKNLREAYVRGENIVRLLAASDLSLERSEIIEIAYDIQSGSYTTAALKSKARLRGYASQIYDHCKDHLSGDDVILDCGAGELTTLSPLAAHLSQDSKLMACDISLSRLRVGRKFADRFMKVALAHRLELFVADMAQLPLADDSVDVALTVHALEPNHGRELALLGELLRVARRKLILFEPSFENASVSARARMIEHGYVRDLPRYLHEAGGRLISVEPLPSPMNPMNPTYCYVAEPLVSPSASGIPEINPEITSEIKYVCPRSGYRLLRKEGYWWSDEGGWAYPEIEGIPCLRGKHAVLMSHA